MSYLDRLEGLNSSATLSTYADGAKSNPGRRGSSSSSSSPGTHVIYWRDMSFQITAMVNSTFRTEKPTSVGSISRLLDFKRVAKDMRRFSASASKFPDKARVVIVGGGIIGNSIAYHLGHQGWGHDTILLEQSKLTSGTTWHAAGLMVTVGSMSETSTELRKYSKQLYQDLEAETGLSTGFSPCGFISIASDADRLEEFRRTAAFNRYLGVDVQEISAREVARLQPLVSTHDVLAGFYVPDDGRVNPVDVTMSLNKGARQLGVRTYEGATVTGTTRAENRVTGVTVAQRGSAPDVHIEADVVVNAAGMWARQFAQASGVPLHNQAAEHYYLITDEMPDVDASWPVVEDPANYAYLRPEGGGMMVGLFEGKAAPWQVDAVPSDFSFGEIPPDWERMTPYLEAAMSRVPRTLEVGAKQFFCGPESFTPDLSPLVGEAPGLKNYFVAAGMNSIGIITGGGIGRLMAHWITQGEPDMDVTHMNVDRVLPYQTNPEYRAARVTESLGRVYKTHYPTYSPSTARGVKRSPIHERLVTRRAAFREVSGWEGVDFYAPEGMDASLEPYSFGRHHWFSQWEKEHHACRNGVIVMDMSFMSKFSVEGTDAGRFLSHMSTGNVDGECGEITYTQWLNDGGRMEADLTVTKLADDKFMIVATDTQHGHVEALMRTHLRDRFPGGHVCITDVTGAYAQLNLQGPHSRRVLQKLTSADVSDEAFPFRAAREIDIGFARVLCVRITYLGELGYELYAPAENALHVYDRLVELGEPEGLVHCGLKALSSLRMEKGYRDFSHDMDNTDTLLQVGLGFTADYEKRGGFVGKEALLEEKARGVPTRRLLQVLLDDPQALMYHGEVVMRDGVAVGDIRAASYGHTLGGAVGLAMLERGGGAKVNKQWIESGEWTVQIGDKIVPVKKVSIQPLYDPKNEQIKL